MALGNGKIPLVKGIGHVNFYMCQVSKAPCMQNVDLVSRCWQRFAALKPSTQ